MYKTDSHEQRSPKSFQNNKRHPAKHRFIKEASKSTFKLTDKQWAYNTGRLAHREKTQKLHKDLTLQPSIDILAATTSRTTSQEAYFRHVEAQVQTDPDFIQLMRIKRWKFQTYQTGDGSSGRYGETHPS
jgi:hypothetical protein